MMAVGARDFSRGVLYVYTGEAFAAECRQSIRSLRRAQPKLPIALISDHDVLREEVDVFIAHPEPTRSYRDKVVALSLSPFEHTLFLDADTWVVEDPTPVFEILTCFDLAICHEPVGHTPTSPSAILIPIAVLPEFNSGVILFRRCQAVNDLVAGWSADLLSESVARYPLHRTVPDQPALRRRLLDGSVRVAVLPPNWNLRTPYPQAIQGLVYILHGKHRLAVAAKSINLSLGPRLFLKGVGTVYGNLLNKTLTALEMLWGWIGR